jgi:hypothetical protein
MDDDDYDMDYDEEDSPPVPMKLSWHDIAVPTLIMMKGFAVGLSDATSYLISSVVADCAHEVERKTFATDAGIDIEKILRGE